MFSYVYMKLLEVVPQHYDRYIDLLSRGRSRKTINRLVAEFVEPGMDVLDIGCGTGTLAIEAAHKGATVTGVDISVDMLKVAREKVASEGLSSSVELIELEVTDLDERFAEDSFDLITSTLVLSELTPDERTFALRECHRLLRKDGTLVIADETVPEDPVERIIHSLLRLPLAVATVVLSGQGTSAVPGLEQLVAGTGYTVFEKESDSLGSFTLVAARKEDELPELKPPLVGEERLTRRLAASVVEYLFRWFPFPARTGLRTHGIPDRDSPVLVTANYDLTVKRLQEGLGKLDCYLLVIPTGGINCWCSSAEGKFNAENVAATLKASRAGELIEQHILVLPQLCGPGVNRRELEKLTGWKARFGPVRSGDITEFVKGGFTKTPEMRQYRFDESVALDLVISMNFQYYILLLAVFKKFFPGKWARLTATFWTQTALTYMLFDKIPGTYGVTRAVVAGSATGAVAGLFKRFVLGEKDNPLAWPFACLGLGIVLGFDLAGITGVLKDEPLMLANKLGIKKIVLFTIHEMGQVHLDSDLCIGCRSCQDVCPMDVYEIDEEQKKSEMARGERCIMCKACINQCPGGALSLVKSGKDLEMVPIGS